MKTTCSFWLNFDGFVKSPSAALRFTPQFLRALHLELFTKPSFRGLFNRSSLSEEFVNSLKMRLFVIPANPGSSPGQAPESSSFNYLHIPWTAVFTGMTTLRFAKIPGFLAP
jgi:hypothetical protein